MKEITHDSFQDYVDKSRAYEDPKIIKLYNEKDKTCRAVTFLRTWLIQWQGETSRQVVDTLVESGHKRGKIIDVVPMGRVQ